jgi:hypothetical protein
MSVAVLAASSSTNTSAWDQPGTLGFLVVFGMAVILYFVFRSMSRQLRKVREAAQAEAEAAAKADGSITLTDGSVTTSPPGNGASPGH